MNEAIENGAELLGWGQAPTVGDEMSATRLQATGSDARAVTQLLRLGQHALPGFLGDVRIVIEGLGNGGDRQIQLLCQVFDGDTHQSLHCKASLTRSCQKTFSEAIIAENVFLVKFHKSVLRGGYAQARGRQ